MPIIPAMEAEVRKFAIQGQPGQDVSKTLSQSVSRLWRFTPVILGMQEALGRRIQSKVSPKQKHETLPEK
jgi:hypothetical protein